MPSNLPQVSLGENHQQVAATTVDGSEIPHHLGCINHCKWWDKLPTSTGAGFQLLTVALRGIDYFLMFWKSTSSRRQEGADAAPKWYQKGVSKNNMLAILPFKMLGFASSMLAKSKKNNYSIIILNGVQKRWWIPWDWIRKKSPTKLNKRKWMTKFWMSHKKNIFWNYLQPQAKPCPFPILNNTRLCLFFVARFSGAKTAMKKMWREWKRVKDDLRTLVALLLYVIQVNLG